MAGVVSKLISNFLPPFFMKYNALIFALESITNVPSFIDVDTYKPYDEFDELLIET